MFGLSAIPAFMQGLGMLIMPPSPRYLHMQGKQAQVPTSYYKCCMDKSGIIIPEHG